MRGVAWPRAALAAVLLLAVYGLSPDAVIRQAAWILLVGGAAGAVVAGIARHRPAARGPWALLAGSLGVLTVVNVLEFPLWRAGPAVLAAATVLELVAFPMIGLAALGFVRRQTPDGDRESAIDAAIVMIALATLLSGTVFTPRTITGATPLSYALSGVAPLVLAGVTSAALRLVFVRSRKVVSTWLIVAAPLCALGGHVLRTLAVADGSYTRGGVEDLLIGVAYALVGVAALHPSMAALTDPAPESERDLTHGRLTILGLALLAAPATLVLAETTVVPVLAAVVLALLVLLRLWRLVLEREAGRDDLRQRATHDPLTGLANRASLLERLDHALSSRSETDLPSGVLYIDLDGFKRVNDDLGHAAGDQLLIDVAGRLQAASRRPDLLARLAGDEFVLVCERTGVEEAVRLARRLIAALEPPFALPGGEMRLGVSVGVAVAAADTPGAEALLADADAAMYQAKQRGGSGYELYGADLGRRLRRRRRLEVDLVEALSAGGLRLEYQPIVSLGQARRTEGFEALLRWDHPDLGAVPPLEAIGIAETTGSIVPLGAWVLREACLQLVRWNGRVPGPDPVTMYVNVSTRELLNPSMAASVARILAETGVSSEHIVLEVTENAILDTSGQGLRTLGALRALGLRIALDDFGTGYSSLTHLKQVPFDVIKIDASFTQNLDGAIPNRAIVEAVISIAQHLGARVVGEGIEDAVQLRALEELGCHLGQGWLFGRPAPAESYTTASLAPAITAVSAGGAGRARRDATLR